MLRDNDGTSSITVGSGGVGVCSLLTIVFVVLKLCKVIDWAWVWVLFPTIISAGFWILMILVVILIALFTK